MVNKDKLLEATMKSLETNNLRVDTQTICNELKKLKSIVDAEYINKDYLYGNDCKGYYKLYISNHLKKLANQYNVGLSGMSLRNRIVHTIENVLNKYYDKNEYSDGLDTSDDYQGYWYWLIK